MTDAKLKFQGTVINGKFVLKPDEKDIFLKYVSGLKDGLYNITIKRHRKMRSNEQMGYLYGVVYRMIADESGMSVEDVHEAMKGKFLRKSVEVTNEKGKACIMETTESLSNDGEVNTAVMAGYIESIRVWAWDFFGMTIPDPVRADVE